MPFESPATLVINDVEKLLPKVNWDNYSSEFRLRGSLSELRLKIRNTTYTDKKRGNIQVDRHNVEVVEEVFPVAPATRTTIRKSYFVFENDHGDTLANSVQNGVALCEFLSAYDGNALTLLTNFES